MATINKPAVIPAEAIKGEITYEDKVIQKIIGVALESIHGLLTVEGGFFSNVAGKLMNTNDVTAGINVEVGQKQVAVDLAIVAEYGTNISGIYKEIKHVIAEQVKKMTDLEVVEVNVDVVDIKTRKQFDEDSETVQDKVTQVAQETGDFASKQTEKAKKAINKTASRVKENGEPRVE